MASPNFNGIKALRHVSTMRSAERSVNRTVCRSSMVQVEKTWDDRPEFSSDPSIIRDRRDASGLCY